MSPKLLAVYLGGRAPKCNTELHDVVFVVGSSIEATYEQLLDRWFGDPLQMHIDSWMALEVVDQYRVTLRREPATQPEKLFFVNLGAYRPGEFTELHANLVLVAEDREQAKQRASASCCAGRYRSTRTTCSTSTIACRFPRSTPGTSTWSRRARRHRWSQRAPITSSRRTC